MPVNDTDKLLVNDGSKTETITFTQFKDGAMLNDTDKFLVNDGSKTESVTWADIQDELGPKGTVDTPVVLKPEDGAGSGSERDLLTDKIIAVDGGGSYTCETDAITNVATQQGFIVWASDDSREGWTTTADSDLYGKNGTLDAGSLYVTDGSRTSDRLRFYFNSVGVTLTSSTDVQFNCLHKAGGGWSTISDTVYTDQGNFTLVGYTVEDVEYRIGGSVTVPAGTTYIEIEVSTNSSKANQCFGGLVIGGISYDLFVDSDNPGKILTLDGDKELGCFEPGDVVQGPDGPSKNNIFWGPDQATEPIWANYSGGFTLENPGPSGTAWYFTITSSSIGDNTGQSWESDDGVNWLRTGGWVDSGHPTLFSMSKKYARVACYGGADSQDWFANVDVEYSTPPVKVVSKKDDAAPYQITVDGGEWTGSDGTGTPDSDTTVTGKTKTWDASLTVDGTKDLDALKPGDSVKMGLAADVPYQPVSDAITNVSGEAVTYPGFYGCTFAPKPVSGTVAIRLKRFTGAGYNQTALILDQTGTWRQVSPDRAGSNSGIAETDDITALLTSLGVTSIQGIAVTGNRPEPPSGGSNTATAAFESFVIDGVDIRGSSTVIIDVIGKDTVVYPNTYTWQQFMPPGGNGAVGEGSESSIISDLTLTLAGATDLPYFRKGDVVQSNSNQSQVWSNASSTSYINPWNLSTDPPTKIFNGDENNGMPFAATTDAAGINFLQAVPFTERVEVYAYSTQNNINSLKINNTDATGASTPTASWWYIEGSGTLTSILATKTTSTGSLYIHAIKVDGKLLVDKGIPNPDDVKIVDISNPGDANHPSITVDGGEWGGANESQVWSALVTNPGGTLDSDSPIQNGFDGRVTFGSDITYALYSGGAFPANCAEFAISIKSTDKVVMIAQSDIAEFLVDAGSGTVSFPITSGSTRTDISNAFNTNVTSWKIGSTGNWNFSGIELNGKLLVDAVNDSQVWSSGTYCSGMLDRKTFESTKAFNGKVEPVGSATASWISDNTGSKEKFDVTGQFPTAETVTIYYIKNSSKDLKVNGNTIAQSGTDNTVQKVDVDVTGDGFNTIEFEYALGLSAVFVDGLQLVDKGVRDFGDTEVTCQSPLKAPTGWTVKRINGTVLDVSHATPDDNAQVWVANDNQAGTEFVIDGGKIIDEPLLTTDVELQSSQFATTPIGVDGLKEIIWSLNDVEQSAGTLNPYKPTGLAFNTEYRVKVKHVAQSIGESEWSQTTTFTTGATRSLKEYYVRQVRELQSALEIAEAKPKRGRKKAD